MHQSIRLDRFWLRSRQLITMNNVIIFCFCSLAVSSVVMTTETHGRPARWRRWSACDVSEATQRKDWRISRAPSVASATSHQKWAEPLPSLLLRFTSFSNPYVVSLEVRHRHFTYVTWRAAHAETKKQQRGNNFSKTGKSIFVDILEK